MCSRLDFRSLWRHHAGGTQRCRKTMCMGRRPEWLHELHRHHTQLLPAAVRLAARGGARTSVNFRSVCRVTWNWTSWPARPRPQRRLQRLQWAHHHNSSPAMATASHCRPSPNHLCMPRHQVLPHLPRLRSTPATRRQRVQRQRRRTSNVVLSKYSAHAVQRAFRLAYRTNSRLNNNVKAISVRLI